MTPTDKRHLRIWYWSGAALVFLILIIGGITRLTGSGLSMTDWKPIMGAIPPITEAQWDDAFEKYKQFPEYQLNNRGMSLSEFQFIFFWEYLHRMAGRLIGLVFIIPFAWFLIRKKMDRRQIFRASILLVLGAGQAVMGWYMVQSGLVDVPMVSPFRLAAHLSLAFMIFGLCVWFALDLQSNQKRPGEGASEFRKWAMAILGLLTLQIVWGAFVAGHHAGHIYNTFPMMNQYWFPPELFLMEPMISNFFQNMSTVQWMHRILGTLLLLAVTGFWVRVLMIRPNRRVQKLSLALFALILLQYATGVFTLIWHVPISLGVIHQATAMVLFGVLVALYHKLLPLGRRPYATAG